MTARKSVRGGGFEVTVTSQIDSFRVSTLATVLA